MDLGPVFQAETRGSAVQMQGKRPGEGPRFWVQGLPCPEPPEGR